MERIHPTGVVTTNGKWLIKQITCYLFIISLTLVGILSGNRAITVLREQIPVERYHTIVIDAGHGGEDGGATSSSGRLESQYNLEIALRLDDLMQEEGFLVLHDLFRYVTPECEWVSCLAHGEKIGLGSREYELVKI